MGHIRLANVCKSFDDLEIIKNVNLEINDREFVVFVGPSGSGKSTLLRLIAGLESVTSGSVFINGDDVTAVRPSWRGLAMVFQNYALYPHMTVRGNMGFGLKMAGRPKTEINEKVEDAARILQIEPYLERKPGELSGGQRQRVAIGRAIVRDPVAFLFDEPLSNLDAELRVQMRLELANLHRSLKATMVYVTHDQIEAMTMADKIVVLREGVVEQVGSPLDLYHHPVNRFVAGFIGSPTMNFLKGRIAGAVENEGVDVELECGANVRVPAVSDAVAVGDPITLGARPEHLRPREDAGAATATGTLNVIERLGGLTYLYAALPDGKVVTVEADGDMRGAVGDQVDFAFNGALCHLFLEDGTTLPPLRRHFLADTQLESA